MYVGVTPIEVLDRMFLTAVELCGHVVDQVLAFTFFSIFCVPSLHDVYVIFEICVYIFEKFKLA